MGLNYIIQGYIMPVYKDNKNGTWYVSLWFTAWDGSKKKKLKRGFATKHEAAEYERKFHNQEQGKMEMTFSDFFQLYKQDIKPRLKLNTWLTKEAIITKHILPYFGNRVISDIAAKDVIKWQNELRNSIGDNGKPISVQYLHTIHNQISAIFNHAVRFYDLPSNPASKAGNVSTSEKKEMQFWTQEEYKKFSEAIMDKPLAFYAFELLYWCGIREGELLALTSADFDFENSTLTINKSYQRLKGKDVITSPKTVKSNRTIKMPDFLCDEMRDLVSSLYDCKPTDRLFPVTKHFLKHEMERGCKDAGVKRIRIHDIRHSAISLLIEMGFSAVAIAERVGHESIDITYRYAHMFPSTQTEMADKLNNIRKESEENVG